MASLFRQFRHCEKGATAVEFGLLALPLFLVTLGTIEFGRAFFVRHDMASTMDRVERRLLIKEAGFTDQEVIDALKDGKFTSATIGAVQTVATKKFRTATITQNLQLAVPMYGAPTQIVVQRRLHIPD